MFILSEQGESLNKKKDKQAESIKNKREDDAILLRNSYLAVINKYQKEDKIDGNASEVKVFIEACKNLARLQHLLQVDKTIEQVKEKDKKEKIPLTLTQVADLDELIKKG